MATASLGKTLMTSFLRGERLARYWQLRHSEMWVAVQECGAITSEVS
jgi:hypothetical protein